MSLTEKGVARWRERFEELDKTKKQEWGRPAGPDGSEAMTVAVVLDSSAALSFSMGARPVGEVLGALVEAPGLRFAVPAVCLAEASTIADDADPARAARPPRAWVGDPDAGHGLAAARGVEQAAGQLGSSKWAVPFLLAAANDAYLLTSTPERYPEADRIIDISGRP